MYSHHRLGLFYCLMLSLSYAGDCSRATVAKSRQSDVDGTTEAVLDTMETLMTGGPEFDPEYKDKLVSCMGLINPELKLASDLAWSGMLEYYDMDGVPDDRWGECLNVGACYEYFEQNATKQELHDVTIYEPCNYVSNLAYYHVSTVICDHHYESGAPGFSMDDESVRALGEVFSHLAMGSAFWHGSHTRLGNVFDNEIIGILSFIMYQASVSNLDNYDTEPVVRDLQSEFRELSGVEINDALTSTFLTANVTEWEAAIESLGIPDYYLSFAGLVCMTLTLALPDSVVDAVISVLADLFSFPEDELLFITEELLPKLREGSSSLTVAPEDQTVLLGDFASAVIKLLYAFVWQEWVITSAPILFEPETNEAGNALIPTVNAFANGLNDFVNDYDENMQNGDNMFPAFERCNDFNPHSKWHQEASAGLTDLIFLSDKMNFLTRGIEKRRN